VSVDGEETTALDELQERRATVLLVDEGSCLI
jgi:hypothetical protein